MPSRGVFKTPKSQRMKKFQLRVNAACEVLEEKCVDEDAWDTFTEGILDVLDVFAATPTKILPALSRIKKDSFGTNLAVGRGAAKNGKECNTPFPNTYTRFRLIPKYFKWSWIQKQCPLFTAEVIEKVDYSDPDGCNQVFEFGTGRHASSRVPPVCWNRLIMSMTLTKIYELRGKRFTKEWFEQLVQVDGTLNWAAAGAWKPAAKYSGVVKVVEHVSGVKGSICQRIAVSQEEELIENWRDLHTYYDCKHASVVLANVCKKHSAIADLIKFNSNAHFQELAKEIHAGEEARVSDLGERVVETTAEVTDACDSAKKKRRMSSTSAKKAKMEAPGHEPATPLTA